MYEKKLLVKMKSGKNKVYFNKILLEGSFNKENLLIKIKKFVRKRLKVNCENIQNVKLKFDFWKKVFLIISTLNCMT